jgi:hypothetical protein
MAAEAREAREAVGPNETHRSWSWPRYAAVPRALAVQEEFSPAAVPRMSEISRPGDHAASGFQASRTAGQPVALSLFGFGGRACCIAGPRLGKMPKLW